MDEGRNTGEKAEEAGTPRRRPNAGYPLSPEKNTGEELVFRYSRDRRLAKAPQKVRELYRPSSPKKKSGFFRSLTATRPLAMLFGSVMVLSVITVIMAVYGGAQNSRIMEGNRVSVTAMRYEGATFMVLNKHRRNTAAYTGPVDMAVSPVAQRGGDEGQPVFSNRIFFSLREKEEFRVSVPFEAEELLIVLQNESVTADLRARPK
ncbi:MAG: hypothetical protein LBS06_08075 [Treponema sp.]|jgi:hypothetical protein|nr:hypothetical protein [Treponema sp.]